MNKPSINGELALDYIKTYPKTSNLALARMMHDECEAVFPTVESARDSIRHYRGAHGSAKRKMTEKKYQFKTPKWNIPEGDNTDYSPFIIPDKHKKGIILSDIHFPYHDRAALIIALEDAYKSKVDFIFLNGDVLDFHQLSVFLKDPRKKNIKEEIEQFEKFLTDIRKNFSKIKIYMKFGNHEERYNSYIMQRAAELWHLDAVQLKNVLKLDGMGIECIEKRRIVKYRHLSILHGHEYNFRISNPVNPARGIFLRAHESSIIGHFHQASEHSETRLNGELITCWSAGCLCGLHPDYAPLNKWTQGFARVRGGADGYFEVENKRIVEGRIV